MKNISYLHAFFFLCLVLLLVNCERNTLELPQTSDDNPDLELEMIVDGTPVSATAGIGDFFNDTDLLVDQDEVFIFTGTLSATACDEDCKDSFSMRIRNFKPGTTSYDASQSLNQRSYKFKNNLEPITDAFLLNLDINTQAQEPQFSWLIDGQSYTQKESNNFRVIDRGDRNEVTATVTILDELTGLTSFYTEELHLDNEEVEKVSSRILIEQIDGDSVSLRIQHTSSNDFPPLEATTWAIQDFSGTTIPQLSIVPQDSVITIAIGEGKRIKNTTQFLDVSATSTIVGIEIKYDEDEGLIYHEADFGYEILDNVEDGSALALQTFEFVMVDENGVSFSSAKGPQSTDALFEILSVDSFIENDKGQNTVKIDCQFSCTLYSDSGLQKNVQNAKATIALATP